MNIPFLDNWRRRHTGKNPGVFAHSPEPEAAGMAQLLSECELLRDHALRAGVELDDSAESLAALDQLPPSWRDDAEELPWLGIDAGLYLGTVVVHTVPGAHWVLQPPHGEPVVALASGRELDVLEAGSSWATTGTPELSQLHAEIAED